MQRTCTFKTSTKQIETIGQTDLTDYMLVSLNIDIVGQP